MAAPRQIVHVEKRGVRDLDEKDAVVRDRADGVQVGAARENMKTVEHEPDRWMIGAAHDLPGIAVVVDVAAPGQRLESYSQAALGGALAELAEILGSAVDPAERVGGYIAAHHQ